MDTKKLRVNGRRLKATLEEMAKIGATLGGGVHRLTVSDEDEKARDLLSQVAPTAMIFVPSIGGRSHVEVENTKWEDCEAGANVLLHCLLQSALEV